MTKLAAKRWIVRPQNQELAFRLSQAVGITPITAQLLVNRGIDTPEAAREFLSPSTGVLHSPFEMKDMQVAVETIRNAVEKDLPIVIYGDYDVDGITGVAVLLRTFARLGVFNVGFYIPDRLVEGYGVNKDAVKELAAQGYKLIVTVDCGVTAYEEVELANHLGMDMVITDHHQPGTVLPPAKGVVNPHRTDCPYPFSDLAGVGVAFKLAQALLCTLGNEPEDWSEVGRELLDLVALGTVADIVPVHGENRVMVKRGLQQIESTDKVGLQALLYATGLNGRTLTADDIGFILAPRINALGRLADAGQAVELLTTSDAGLATKIAAELDMYNTRRREIETQILDEAVELVETQGFAEDKVIVVAKSGWHPGVIGIVASRLVDRYYRPVVLLSLEDGVGKGSARSIPGFDLFKALQCCDDLLEAYGGHTMAAGLTVEEHLIPALRKQLSELADEWLSPEDFIPCLTADVEVALDQLNVELLEEIRALEPFGEGNPVPIMVSRNVPLCNFRAVGKNDNHLSVDFLTSMGRIHGIYFGRGELAPRLVGLTNVDIAYIPEINEWNGTRSVQVVVQDLAVPSRQMRVGLLKRLAASVHNIRWVHTYENAVGILDGYLSLAAASETEETLELIEWWDGRNEDKSEYLRSLLHSSFNQLVIWVNRPYYALLLAENIQEAFPALAGSVTAWSPHWPDKFQQEILAESRSQPWRVLVTDAPLVLPNLLERSPDYVIYHLPPSTDWLGLLARQCNEYQGQVHLLYDQQDHVQACQLLRTAWPDAEHLRMLYVAVTKAVRGGKVEFSELENQLCQWSRLSPMGIQRGLAVFEELGLCHCEDGIVVMEPVPEKKLDLYSSLKYNEIVSAIKTAELWFARAMISDVETLRRQLDTDFGRQSFTTDSRAECF